MRYYPFVRAQPVRPIDLAAFFAAIANEGMRPAYAIAASSGRARWSTAARVLTEIGSADRASFFQLKTMLQGVLQRGTAHNIAGLAPYVAGKTGTSDDENDAWFVGFSNDVTIAVWVGYDNKRGKRTLGSGQTGGKVAVPIFEPIMQAVWAHEAPRTALSPPSPEARQLLVASRVDADSGDEYANPNARTFVEYLRRDRNGQPRDSRYELVSRDEVYSTRIDDGYNPQGLQPWGAPWDDRYRSQPQSPRSQPSAGGFFGLFQRRDDDQLRLQQQQQQQRQQQWQQQQQQRRPSYPSYPGPILKRIAMRMHIALVVGLALISADAKAQQFQIEDVASVDALPVARLKPKTIASRPRQR